MFNVNLIKTRSLAGLTTHRQYISFVITGLLTITLLVVIWMNGIFSLYIGEDFAFSADVITKQKLYDNNLQRYTGHRTIKSTFSMRQAGTKPNNEVLIYNTLRANEVSGDPSSLPVPVASRQYLVNRRDGTVLQTAESSHAAGYLLAPRNLHKQPFAFWHTLYQTKATMHYVGQENLYGLSVDIYESSYDTNEGYVKVLGSALKEDADIWTKPDFKIWIEPTSGWLVNYWEDSTTYRKLATGQLQPLSQQTTNFTQATIRQHAEYAYSLKHRLSVSLQLVPRILVGLTITFALYGSFRLASSRRTKMHNTKQHS